MIRCAQYTGYVIALLSLVMGGHLEQNRIEYFNSDNFKLSDEEARDHLNDLILYGYFFNLSIDLLCIAGIDGHFKHVNPAFGVLGYTREELLSRTFFEFIHPDDIVSTQLELKKLSKEVPTIHFENRYRCKDGTYKWLSWTSMPQKKTGLLFAVARDVTEAKKREAEMHQLNIELKEAIRLRIETTCFIIHELKNPLTSLQLKIQMIIKNLQQEININDFKKNLSDHILPSIEKIATFISKYENAANHIMSLNLPIQRMNTIIADLLEAARIETGALKLEPGPVDLSKIVEETINSQRPFASEKSLVIKSEIPADCRNVFGDPLRISQILTNLIHNAIKFTDTGGSINVLGRMKEQQIEVQVTDTGKGIAKDDLPYIFNPFWQLKDTARMGTGLGLSIVKSIVEAQGGKIWVESQIGIGTSFFFTLPRMKPSSL
jgi:PAS domain S-box-containing protein